MIIDKIKNINEYKGISEKLDRAIEYISSNDALSLDDGKHEIIGNDLFAAVAGYETVVENEGKYEAHRKYIDIQMISEGYERIIVSNIDSMNITHAYDPDRDVCFLEGPAETIIEAVKGMFCIFFPWDAHKPGVDSSRGRSKVRKVVLKVHV